MDTLARNRRASRSKQGTTIIELLIVALILVASMAIFGELSVLLTTAVVTTTNKVDGLQAARSAINRISADVRQARAIGDIYGEAGTARLQFPAAKNPIYGADFGSSAPPGGWPAPPWSNIMKLSDTILVLQIPVTFEDKTNAKNPNNGMPLIIPAGTIASGVPTYNMENLDTVVYEVVKDPQRSGEYLLQCCRFPGVQIASLNTNYLRSITTPQTLLKGLIGPKSQTDGVTPTVFSYLPRANSGPPISTPTNLDIETVAGVGIDLEIKNTGFIAQQGDGRYPQFLGIHTEAFMRSNKNMILKNTN